MQLDLKHSEGPGQICSSAVCSSELHQQRPYIPLLQERLVHGLIAAFGLTKKMVYVLAMTHQWHNGYNTACMSS